MKTKALVLSCLVGAVLVCIPAGQNDYSRAETRDNNFASKIGVVSIKKILDGSQKRAKFKREVAVKEGKAVAELDRLSKEIEAADAALKTLKPESTDYMSMLQQRFDKQASYQAKKQFSERQLELADKQWHEVLYKKILQITAELAKEKGLVLVLEGSEPEIPAMTMQELILTIGTNKVLYRGGCLDITEEVIARLDKDEVKTGATEGADP